MTARLEGKIALVTGGASGIGLGIVEKFLDAGAKVVIADVDVSRGEAETRRLTEAGKAVSFIKMDVTSQEQWEAAIGNTVRTLGGLNVLVNNAGICEARNVENESLDNFRRMIAINLEGVFLGTKLAIAHMKKAGGGSIINIASIEGVNGEPMLPAYNATKAGVRLFSRSAAIHCARAKYNIRINCVCPGVIETPILEKVAATADASELEALFKQKMARIAVGHMGKPNDVANACLYLASDESSYVIGTDVVVDGGYLA
jgi:NAD(P)-dependent dehydrogenase (short-subunit alcohol dehydrogenase family)